MPAFSSAQLKKKGKRVCHGCVSKKDAAAAAQQDAANTAAAATHKEAMKDAFAVRLNSTPTQAATACLCCGSKTAARFAPCIRCSVDCCSLKCFDQHDCDAYLEAKRTMPTELIPDEDRFRSTDEILSGWTEVLGHLRRMPPSVSQLAVEDCAQQSTRLAELDGVMAPFVEWFRPPFCDLYPPRVSRPWWNPAVCARIRVASHAHALATELIKKLLMSSHCCTAIVDACAAALSRPTPSDLTATVHGDWVPVPTIDRTSPCFLPARLLHKLLTLVRWILRAMGSEWVQAHFLAPGDVSSDAFGALPTLVDEPLYLGYLELPAPDTGLRTLVPIFGVASDASSRFCRLRQHLGQRMLSMVFCDGRPVLDRGLHLTATDYAVKVCAVTGWTGDAANSFSVAPAYSLYFSERKLLELAKLSVLAAAIRCEIEARKRPDYFHLVLAIKQMVPEDEWPSVDAEALFIATPQSGVESELVELSLLESLAEDAAAGNEQAQLLLARIEEECASPIAEVISRQKSRLDQMLEYQAAQLRVHAEAVQRAENRARIKAAAAASEGEQKADATTAASPSASSASVLAPTSAASSSSSSVSTSRASSSLAGPAYSWTQSREYKGLESLRAPGRKKYSTIMSAAKRLLYSLSPVSVNKRAGSHIVFHFASGAPATLVQMHAGARSKDSTAHTTRLFAQLSEVAMQQGMAGTGVIEGASKAGREGAGHRLLN